MNHEQNDWLFGWAEIAAYLHKSIRTTQRYCRKWELPVLYDIGGRPMASRKQIDEFLIRLNKCRHYEEKWNRPGLKTAVEYFEEKEKEEKESAERYLQTLRPTRGRF